MERARRREVMPWDGLMGSGIVPEKRLFVAMILQAFHDLQRRNAKGENAAARTVAMSWVFDPNEDFRVVCEIAGWHPDYVRRKAAEILQGERPHWRAAARTGKRYEERKAYYQQKKLKQITHHQPQEQCNGL